MLFALRNIRFVGILFPVRFRAMSHRYDFTEITAWRAVGQLERIALQRQVANFLVYFKV